MPILQETDPSSISEPVAVLTVTKYLLFGVEPVRPSDLLLKELRQGQLRRGHMISLIVVRRSNSSWSHSCYSPDSFVPRHPSLLSLSLRVRTTPLIAPPTKNAGVRRGGRLSLILPVLCYQLLDENVSWLRDSATSSINIIRVR